MIAGRELAARCYCAQFALFNVMSVLTICFVQTMFNDINRIQGNYGQNGYMQQQPGYGMQQDGYGMQGYSRGGKHKKKVAYLLA